MGHNSIDVKYIRTTNVQNITMDNTTENRNSGDETSPKISEDEKSSKECDEYWEKEKGIKFSIATADDVKEMQYMMKNEFFPEEPLSSNAGISFKESHNGGWLHR